MLANRLLSCVGGEETLYVDDVFSAYTYTGTGNAVTQTINNGIDLVGKGGLVWTKSRTTANSHYLMDTIRGKDYSLSSSDTTAQSFSSNLSSFNANGFTVNALDRTNQLNIPFASWTFRKAPKFFDVVTYTGNGVAGRQIPHSLGVAPGMVIVKRTDTTGDWAVYHRSLESAAKFLILNTTAAQNTDAVMWNNTAPTPSDFTVGTYNNTNGATYVAYLFAHDTSTDGIIQCGSFTGNTTITLGWEPQYLLVKRTDSAGNWMVIDTSRQFDVGSSFDYLLYPDSSSAENTSGANLADPTSTGFVGKGFGSSTMIYLAIRRPNKPPTVGTGVYNAIARTGTGAAATVTGVGFAPDLVHTKVRTSTFNNLFFDRLRGAGQYLFSDATNAEAGPYFLTAIGQDGVTHDANGSAYTNSAGNNYVDHFFKRSPGVFDICCYTGTGVAKTEVHSLGVVPELIIVKGRSAASNWNLEYSFGSTSAMGANLNSSAAAFGPNTYGSFMSNGVPTSSTFSLTSAAAWNGSGSTYVAYLFATKAGISKVFSYTGNGSTQTIDCGFTTGSRFVMIKRVDSTGDWYVWDSVRGIVAGNDPHLSLNTTAAEVTTDDSIDPNALGFICNQVAATNINVNAATYIGLAFA